MPMLREMLSRVGASGFAVCVVETAVDRNRELLPETAQVQQRRACSPSEAVRASVWAARKTS